MILIVSSKCKFDPLIFLICASLWISLGRCSSIPYSECTESKGNITLNLLNDKETGKKTYIKKEEEDASVSMLLKRSCQEKSVERNIEFKDKDSRWQQVLIKVVDLKEIEENGDTDKVLMIQLGTYTKLFKYEEEDLQQYYLILHNITDSTKIIQCTSNYIYATSPFTQENSNSYGWIIIGVISLVILVVCVIVLYHVYRTKMNIRGLYPLMRYNANADEGKQSLRNMNSNRTVDFESKRNRTQSNATIVPSVSSPNSPKDEENKSPPLPPPLTNLPSPLTGSFPKVSRSRSKSVDNLNISITEPDGSDYDIINQKNISEDDSDHEYDYILIGNASRSKAGDNNRLDTTTILPKVQISNYVSENSLYGEMKSIQRLENPSFSDDICQKTPTSIRGFLETHCGENMNKNSKQTRSCADITENNTTLDMSPQMKDSTSTLPGIQSNVSSHVSENSLYGEMKDFRGPIDGDTLKPEYQIHHASQEEEKEQVVEVLVPSKDEKEQAGEIPIPSYDEKEQAHGLISSQENEQLEEVLLSTIEDEKEQPEVLISLGENATEWTNDLKSTEEKEQAEELISSQEKEQLADLLSILSPPKEAEQVETILSDENDDSCGEDAQLIDRESNLLEYHTNENTNLYV